MNALRASILLYRYGPFYIANRFFLMRTTFLVAMAPEMMVPMVMIPMVMTLAATIPNHTMMMKKESPSVVFPVKMTPE